MLSPIGGPRYGIKFRELASQKFLELFVFFGGPTGQASDGAAMLVPSEHP